MHRNACGVRYATGCCGHTALFICRSPLSRGGEGRATDLPDHRCGLACPCGRLPVSLGGGGRDLAPGASTVPRRVRVMSRAIARATAPARGPGRRTSAPSGRRAGSRCRRSIERRAGTPAPTTARWANKQIYCFNRCCSQKPPGIGIPFHWPCISFVFIKFPPGPRACGPDKPRPHSPPGPEQTGEQTQEDNITLQRLTGAARSAARCGAERADIVVCLVC